MFSKAEGFGLPTASGFQPEQNEWYRLRVCHPQTRIAETIAYVCFASLHFAPLRFESVDVMVKLCFLPSWPPRPMAPLEERVRLPRPKQSSFVHSRESCPQGSSDGAQALPDPIAKNATKFRTRCFRKSTGGQQS